MALSRTVLFFPSLLTARKPITISAHVWPWAIRGCQGTRSGFLHLFTKKQNLAAHCTRDCDKRIWASKPLLPRPLVPKTLLPDALCSAAPTDSRWGASPQPDVSPYPLTLLQPTRLHHLLPVTDYKGHRGSYWGHLSPAISAVSDTDTPETLNECSHVTHVNPSVSSFIPHVLSTHSVPGSGESDTKGTVPVLKETCNQRKADMNLGNLNFQLPLGWQLISHHHTGRLLAGRTNNSPLKFNHRELDSQPFLGFCYFAAPAYTPHLILPMKPDLLAEVMLTVHQGFV